MRHWEMSNRRLRAKPASGGTPPKGIDPLGCVALPYTQFGLLGPVRGTGLPELLKETSLIGFESRRALPRIGICGFI